MCKSARFRRQCESDDGSYRGIRGWRSSEKKQKKPPTGLDDEAFHSACVFSGNFVYCAEISLNLLGV